MSLAAGGFDTINGDRSLANVKDRFNATQEVIVPSDLLIKRSKIGAPLIREPVKIRSDAISYASNGNNEIIIRCSNDGYYDFGRGYVTFDVALSATGSTYVRLAQGAWSIIYRLKTLLGFELENIQDYNRIYSLLWKSLNDARQSENLGLGLMGLGTASARNALGATTAHYAIPILSGFFSNEVLPLSNFISIPELRLTLADASTCVETDGTSPIITVSNVQFHCERINASSAYVGLMQGKILSEGITLGFPTWQIYSQSVASGSQNIQSLIINHKSASLSSIVQIWVPQQTINTTTVSDKFVTYSKLTNKHQWKVNGKFYPEEPLTYSDTYAAEAYFTYLNWLTDEWQLDGELRSTPAPIGVTEFALGTSFLTILDINGYPEDKNVINPIGTENSTVQLQFDAYLTNALAVPYLSVFMVKYYKQIYINPKGLAVITY